MYKETEWGTLNSGAYCYYDNIQSNAEKYGLLYNHYAINSGKLAPDGWHVATFDDWVKLLEGLGIIDFEPNTDIGPLVDAADWDGPFYTFSMEGASGTLTCTNSTGFTALPNGYRDLSEAVAYETPSGFRCLEAQASWWTPEGKVIYLGGVFGINIFWKNRSYDVGSGVRLVKNTKGPL